jgi:hypothetical protein
MRQLDEAVDPASAPITSIMIAIIVVGDPHHHRRRSASSSPSPRLSPGDGGARPGRDGRKRIAAPGNSPYSRRSSMPSPARPTFPHRHLLGIEGLSPFDINALLDLADEAVEVSRQIEKKRASLRGRTQINLFSSPRPARSPRSRSPASGSAPTFMNMSVASSSVKKGETLIDTAATLNAMRPDIIIVRHQTVGAVHLLARKVGCSVVNAGDGAHEHPTQALLDALTIRHRKESKADHRDLSRYPAASAFRSSPYPASAHGI